MKSPQCPKPAQSCHPEQAKRVEGSTHLHNCKGNYSAKICDSLRAAFGGCSLARACGRSFDSLTLAQDDITVSCCKDAVGADIIRP